LSLSVTLFASAEAQAKKAAVIQGYDAITAPGVEVTLEVKVERARFFPTRVDLKGQKIHFVQDGNHLGVAKSNNDGVAKLKAVFYTTGLKVITATLDENSKYSANVTDNRILVTDPETPMLVSDIDHTLSDISSRDFLRTPDTKIPELPKASEVVNRLNQNITVFYMTARDDAFIKRTKFWLDYKKFPKAPSFYWDFGFWNGVPYNHGEYKTKVLKDIARTHKKVLIGVGDKPHDVEAYRANGLRAYYIGLPGFELPKHTIVVKTWEEIEDHLAMNPIGTLDGDPEL
ncbi:MAG: hypothetical protein KC493_17705, partial [Bacteriovoracaceae bacterium]|nr:hypothetical protein [Bacteriovoracaceae bacterium]